MPAIIRPLFHVILVPFVWVFGEEYWYGRLVGFLGTLITAVTIGYVVYREERHRAAAILAGLSFLASNYVYHVGPLFRQHMMMVMFETLAVAVLAHVTEISDSRRRRRTMIVGLLLLLAAGFTKQLAVATCAAVFGFLFIRNPRRSLYWGAIFAAVAGALFLWINVATHGDWWANIIAANVNTFFPHQFVNLFKQWFRLHRVLIVLAGLFAAYELYFTRLSLYSVWWVLAVANSILSGKWGAGDSYFATAIAATCLLAGLFAARTSARRVDLPRHSADAALPALASRLAVFSPSIITAAGLVIPLLYLVYGLSVVKMPTEGRFFGWLSDGLGLEFELLGSLRVLRRGGLDGRLRDDWPRADPNRRQQRLADRGHPARKRFTRHERGSRVQPARRQGRDHQSDAAQKSVRE